MGGDEVGMEMRVGVKRWNVWMDGCVSLVVSWIVWRWVWMVIGVVIELAGCRCT